MAMTRTTKMNKNNRKKKAIIFALCVACLSTSFAGCSKASKTDTKGTSKSISTSAKGSDDSDSSDLSQQVKDLQGQLDDLKTQLQNTFGEDLFNGDGDITDISGEVHEIYDDTAVVEAYKSGDDSKLTDDKDKYILKELKKAVSEIIKDGMSDYDKEKAVYDYVFSGTHFNDDSLSAIVDEDSDKYSHTPYGFFHDHSTICVGNATTIKLFLDVLGIDSKIIHSTEQGEHAWNVVQIDGKWYHVDVTFDGGDEAPDYSYFNVPDSVKDDGSYPWNKSDFPACTSTDKCLICEKAKKLSDIYALPGELKKLISEGEGSAYYYIEVPEGVDTSSVSEQLTDVMENLISNVANISTSSVIITEDGKKACFGVTYTDYSDYDISDDDENVLGIDYSKLADELKDQLGSNYVGNAGGLNGMVSY